jgi:hypothetical protein
MAAAALAQITPGGDASQGAWVFRISSTRYLAFNFMQKAHGSAYIVVYDQNFAVVSSFSL